MLPIDSSPWLSLTFFLRILFVTESSFDHLSFNDLNFPPSAHVRARMLYELFREYTSTPYAQADHEELLRVLWERVFSGNPSHPSIQSYYDEEYLSSSQVVCPRLIVARCRHGR